ncbi:hypothetical protein SPRG_03413 [Saprolegnia parasitica CBS 223.65]|uniref:Uncharacterized protein n=1 Tax=Saprolegnia parasitica (strain CBS 223.65) TaxID=695850 RepID=A0A067D0D3_SAPPC|nr:hypothetical protein SPRG_03413 [Saprolegnia parasitica CBS 223.65]KDO32196.1 hypothetical protein SPRG_03413 [Saprolegnia parasitica CBS 223.65]|eukprot:XP_012197376.1 hypothetical protein SPRG_03413 [Saprolegnia parasitica CBS 223.65]
MGQPNAKPVGERRATTESLALLVAAYSALVYHATFTWLFPLVDALFGDVFVFSSLCRGLSTVVQAAHLGVHLPYVAFVLFDKDEIFYRTPTHNVWDFDREETSTHLLRLPWLALWITLFLYYFVEFFVAPTNASTTATTATVSKPLTPVKLVPHPIPEAKMQDDKLVGNIIHAKNGVLKGIEKGKLKPKADRTASSLGAAPSTAEQPVPTPKTKGPKKSLRKRVLSWLKSSERSQRRDGDDKATAIIAT